MPEAQFTGQGDLAPGEEELNLKGLNRGLGSPTPGQVPGTWPLGTNGSHSGTMQGPQGVGVPLTSLGQPAVNQLGDRFTDVTQLEVTPNTSAITKDVLNRAAFQPGAQPGTLDAIQQQLAMGKDPRVIAAMNQGSLDQQRARKVQTQTMDELRGAGAADRSNQNALIYNLQQAAAGKGPSAAQAQLQQGVSANIAAQHALARSGRGGNLVAGLRNAGQAGEQLALQTQAQSAILRAQEQQAATATLGNVLQGARGLDIHQSQGVGNMANNIRNMDIQGASVLGGLELQGRSLDDNAVTQGVNAAQKQQMLEEQQRVATMNALIQAENLRTGARGQNLGLGAQQFDQTWGLVKDLAVAGGTMGATLATG